MMERGRAAAAALAGALVLACVIVLVVRDGQAASSVVLSDQNQFESQPAWDAQWSQTDVQHHLISTQRAQTELNDKVDGEIKRLDGRVEELMKLLKNRPPGAAGPGGEAGGQGERGPAGDKGPVGEAGPAGRVGQPGASGDDGHAGPDGRQGMPGLAGPTGNSGTPGLPGPRGMIGGQGPPGQDGYPGQRGPQGMAGDMGPRGPIAQINVFHHLTDLAAGQNTVKAAALERMQARQQGLLNADKDSESNIEVTKNAAPGGYTLTVRSREGHDLRALLQGPEGFSQEFSGRGYAESGDVRSQRRGDIDYLQVKDLTSGREKYFKITRK